MPERVVPRRLESGERHRLTATEDLFTSIHKALRSMIYNIGGRLQSADFADKTALNLVLADLQHEFANAVSRTCILCLLHSHASHEERSIFPSMQPVDPDLVRGLIDDHHEILRRLEVITKMANELGGIDAPEQRIELGARVNRETNEFFAFYLAHMNKEEVTIVPAMKEQFTDDQLRAMQGTIIGSMPKERLVGFLRWMLPALSMRELTGMMAGMKHGAPPELLQLAVGIGQANVDPARWAIVRQRVGF